jgi:hypothetical protein
MKKYMLILFQWPFELLMAQTVQVRADAGYNTGMKWQGSHGRFAIANSPCYEGAVSYTLGKTKKLKDLSFELQYAYAYSSMHFEPYNSPIELDEENITVQSVFIGAGKKFGTGNVQPFGQALMGITVLNPYIKAPITRFTFAFSGGIKIVITSFMGIYLQAKALFPVMYNKVYVAWEPGFGLTNGVSPNGVAVAGYFGGGLYMTLVH